ncbi:hypothetical protein DFJ74DRAFT_765555 [Hyaloraphidium curvatum]|nr:hypothetical protein DFJ74DRAFT_765555 [Hyaloraphidium curvatum]
MPSLIGTSLRMATRAAVLRHQAPAVGHAFAFLPAALPARSCGVPRPAPRRAYASAPNPMELFNSAFFRKLSANPSAMLEVQEISMRMVSKVNPSGSPTAKPSMGDMMRMMMDSQVRADLAKLKTVMDQCGITTEDVQELGRLAQKMMGESGAGAGGDQMATMMALLGGGAAAPAPPPPAAPPRAKAPPKEVPAEPLRPASGHKRFLPSQPKLKEVDAEEGEIVGESKPGSEGNDDFLSRMKGMFGRGRN